MSVVNLVKPPPKEKQPIAIAAHHAVARTLSNGRREIFEYTVRHDVKPHDLAAVYCIPHSMSGVTAVTPVPLAADAVIELHGGARYYVNAGINRQSGEAPATGAARLVDARPDLLADVAIASLNMPEPPVFNPAVLRRALTR